MTLALFYKTLEWKLSKRPTCLSATWLHEMHFWFSYFENLHVKLSNIRNVLTVYLNFTKFIVCILWIIARVCNIRFSLIVVNNVASKNRTVDSLEQWSPAYKSLYIVETKMAVFLWNVVRNKKGKILIDIWLANDHGTIFKNVYILIFYIFKCYICFYIVYVYIIT